MATRPLTLHASALTDDEYTLYTTALIDLAGEDEDARLHSHDDSYYASLCISAREARAWIRGRYTDLTHPSVDALLKLFCPNLGIRDTLSGGQFFAALRLVTHLRHGKPLDGSLVFVQAHPDDAITSSSIPTPQDAPSSDSRRTSRDLDIPLVDTDSPRTQPTTPARPQPPPKPPVASSSSGPSSTTNPFINRSRSQPSQSSAQPSVLVTSQSQPSVVPPLPPRKPTLPPPPPPRHSSLAGSSNAALAQTPTTPSAFAFWHNHSQPGSTPTNPNVLIQQSLQAGRIAQSLKKAEKKLETERVMEVLKRSSKSGGPVRNRSESPTKDTIPASYSGPFSSDSAVINSKTRSSTSSASLSGSASASSDELTRPSTRASSATVTIGGIRGPALPPRRVSLRRTVSPPPMSDIGSTKSFEQVANASIPVPPRSANKPKPQSPFVSDRERSLERSPPLQRSDLPLPPPPPTHPDRKLHNGADSSNPGADYDQQILPASSRVYRSRSVHHTNPPIPPPRRKRPESVQYGVYGGMAGGSAANQDRVPSPTRTERTDRSSRSLSTVFSSPASLPARGTSGNGVSRQMSLSLHGRRRDSLSRDGPPKDDSPISNIKNTLMGLRPGLEAARYKAEAGLNRRGYVPHSNSSLFHEEGEDRLVASSNASSVTVDSVESEDDGGLGQDISILDMNESELENAGPKSAKSGERWNGRKWEDSGRTRSSSGNGVDGDARKPRRPWEVERDEMKWPSGDGWKPL